MPAVTERYRRVADGFTRRVAGVGPGQWRLPTPCAAWDVGRLVEHVIDTHCRVLTAAGQVAPGGDQVGSGEDRALRWGTASSALAAAVEDPAAAARPVGGDFGDQTLVTLVGTVLCTDTLIHTWDLAQATGQDERLEPEAVDAAMAFLEPYDGVIRGPGGFAPKLPVPDGGDPQVRLLSFAGRVV